MTYKFWYSVDGKAEGVVQVKDVASGAVVFLEKADLTRSENRSRIAEAIAKKTGLAVQEVESELASQAAEEEERRAAQRAARQRPEASSLQGQEIRIGWPDPWPQPVALADILEEVEGVIRRHIVLGPEQTVAAVLWVAWTWVLDRFDIAPLLFISSPVKRCGKTTFLRVLSAMVARPLLRTLSPAALFRVVEVVPSLLNG